MGRAGLPSPQALLVPLLVGGGCRGGRLKGLFVTGVCLFILYCYFYYFEFKPDDLTVVFPTRRSKSPVLPSLLGVGVELGAQPVPQRPPGPGSST